MNLYLIADAVNKQIMLYVLTNIYSYINRSMDVVHFSMNCNEGHKEYPQWLNIIMK